ncbi:MAG: PDZ domain-containing protein [Deltaproteobacteria bacterium]|nr:PDZ domain-containing protein [Deltaproteobacteria bacterium]
MKRVLSFLFIFLLSQTTFADEQLSLEQKTADIDQVVSLVKSAYGPRDYKKSQLGIDVDQLREKYVSLLPGTTNREFYYLVLRLVAEFKDSHFLAMVPSTHVSSLGFTTEWVDGKILIDAIDRRLLRGKFDFEKGDEVLAVNGVPVQEVAQELALQRGSGFEQTSKRVGARLVSFRPARLVPVPTGKARVTIRRGTSDIIETVELEGIEEGERLDEAPKTGEKGVPNTPQFGKRRTLRDFDISIREMMGERSYQCSGTTRIAIPKDATILMKEPFVAYFHPTEKGNVGYLRIPHYSPEDEEGNRLYEERFRQYEWAVTKLEENTVGLIIDQDHNCGGSVDFLEQMAGLFLREDYLPLQFQFLASKAEYLAFKGWLDSEPKNTLAREFFSDTVNLVKKHWLLGDFLTPKTAFLGNHKLKPHPRGYTKPIVMLIDEMSGSGGDAFPALLQGNGRAKLLGTRTMGAGGHVIEAPSLNNSGIELRLTKSLFYRPDGVAVENNGAIPDFPYTITRDDFVYKYKNYQKFYLQKLLELVP